jgi:hypothetical protein
MYNICNTITFSRKINIDLNLLHKEGTWCSKPDGLMLLRVSLVISWLKQPETKIKVKFI